MRISEVEKLIGISSDNIRFYERMGLISPSRDESNGYRIYEEVDIKNLSRIKFFRSIGLGIESTKNLIHDETMLEETIRKHCEVLQTSIHSTEESLALCHSLLEGEDVESLYDNNVHGRGLRTEIRDDLLSILPDDLAVKHYESLLRGDVVDGEVSEELIDFISNEIGRLFEREKIIDDMLRGCNPDDKKRLLSLIREHDTELYCNLNRYIYNIEDIKIFDQDVVKVALCDFDNEELLMAAKAVSPDVAQIFGSAHGVESFENQLRNLGPIPLKRVLRIHNAILSRMNNEVDARVLG